MELLIQEKLREIERQENCRILLAVESGSRAWGFASPDSDYDVRFIYARPRESYLRLDRARDVIERPISDALDINGWDVDKTLKLLHRSNPTVFEWFSSPIVYQTSPFAEEFKSVMGRYFLRKSSLWHYVRMAEGTTVNICVGIWSGRRSTFMCCARSWRAAGSWRRGRHPPCCFPSWRRASSQSG